MTDFLADLPIFLTAIWQTLYMVIVSLILSGFLGLAMGVGLYVTRPGNLLGQSCRVRHPQSRGQHRAADPVHHLPGSRRTVDA